MKTPFLIVLVTFSFLFSGLQAQDGGEITKEEMKFWKNKTKIYKKRPMQLRAEITNYQNQIKDLKRRNKDLISRVQPGGGDVNNDLVDSLRWAVIQLKGDLKKEQADLEKLMAAYRALKETAGMGINPGLVYRVQIGAYVFHDIDAENEHNDIVVERSDGFNKFVIGNFNTYDECNSFKNELRRQGLTDAWIVPYVDGIRVTIDEARSFENSRGN